MRNVSQHDAHQTLCLGHSWAALQFLDSNSTDRYTHNLNSGCVKWCGQAAAPNHPQFCLILTTLDTKPTTWALDSFDKPMQTVISLWPYNWKITLPKNEMNITNRVKYNKLLQTLADAIPTLWWQTIDLALIIVIVHMINDQSLLHPQPPLTTTCLCCIGIRC